MMREHARLVGTALAAALAVLGAGPAAATPLACDATTATECQITTVRDLGAGGTFEVDRTLHIFGPGGQLRTNAGSTLTLNITGGLTIDIGGKITGMATTGGASGATITITTGGAVLLAGDGTGGALISVDQTGASCSASKAGKITITSSFASAGASITTKRGSKVTADADCTAGEIKIVATKGGVDIQGLVESASAIAGSASKRPGGGPITISASCNLTINDTGRVSSRGKDPGADLVHLEAGGNVLIIGLVESTGPGHSAPINPANSCAGQKHPDKPANSTACVEVWAGTNLTIDQTATSKGEINADTGQAGGHQIAWIDLFAKGDIVINGPGAGPYAAGAHPYAVHANEFVSTSTGGLVTVKSKAGKVTLSGQAIQADGGLGKSSFVPALGGVGGVVVIEAGGTATPGGDVDLAGASVRARGAGSGGGVQAGGDIAIRSFNGHVLGAAPGELNAAGGGGQLIPDPGTVTLRGCNAAPPAVSYGGTSTPAATTAAPSCGGPGPQFPAYVVFLVASCGPPPPCLPPDCVPPPCLPPDCVPPPCEGPDCLPQSFCEKGSVKAVLDPTTGRFPGNAGADVVVDLRTQSLQAAIDSVTDVNGDGYIIVGVIAQSGGAPGGQSKQEIDVTRAYSKPFALIGCGVMLFDPLSCDNHGLVQVHAGATSPEFPVGSGVTLYFQEISTNGSVSAPGWVVEGDGRFLEAIGSQGNMQGMRIVGNGNTLRNSFADRNFAGGVIVQGNANTIDTVKATNNGGGDGIQVTGNSNTITKSAGGGQGVGNGGAGIRVSGVSNLISGNSGHGNVGDGINVGGGTATNPNIVKNNVAGGPYLGNIGNGIVLSGTGKGAAGPVDLDANTAQNNGLDGFKVPGTGHQLRNNVSGGLNRSNNACQYEVAAGNINATGNKRGFLTIPGANGSAFPTGCF